MGKFDSEIAHRRHQTRLDELALKVYQSGASEKFEVIGNQRVNVTRAAIIKLKSRIAKDGRLTKWFVKINT